MKSQGTFPFVAHLGERLVPLSLCFLLIVAFFPAVSTALPAGYRDTEKLLQDFFNLMSQYPTLMTYESIGKSYQGRDVPLFKIGNPNGGKVLFTTVSHGDEPQGAEVGYYMAQWILQRREPAIADRILQNNLIMIAIENIDSYGIKRKTMQLYGYLQGASSNLYGVDLDRNMPVGWGGKDSSNNVTDMHYEGPSAGSELESQALIHVFQTYKPKFQLDYHYGGGMVFGKPSGYARMSSSISQYHDVVANKIKTLAASRGVNVFGYGQLGISGDVADQAYVSGNSTSYLLEAGNWPAPTVGQIQSVLLPELLPFLIVFSQESEVVQKPFDGSFESGDFSAWTGTSVTPGETATIVNTMPYKGNFSAKFASNGTSGFEAAYCYESVSASNDLYASGYFYISQSGITENNDRFYFIKFLAGNVSVAYAGWRRVGSNDSWELTIRDAAGWTSVYSTSSPTINTWYKLELCWTEDATRGQSELDVDGTRICSIQNQNTTVSGDVNQVRYGLAEVYSSGPTTVYADSCHILGPPPWDINQDSTVNIHDLAILATAYGSTPSSSNWNPAADINADGKVDIRDLAMLAVHYGEQYS
jgi:hypothetical protein